MAPHAGPAAPAMNSVLGMQINASDGIDYLTDRLIPEVRLNIYGFLLHFQQPLGQIVEPEGNQIRRLVPRRVKKSKNHNVILEPVTEKTKANAAVELAICRVNTVIRSEALPVFFDSNKFNINHYDIRLGRAVDPKQFFCGQYTHNPRAHPQLLSMDYVRHLYMSDLTIKDVVSGPGDHWSSEYRADKPTSGELVTNLLQLEHLKKVVLLCDNADAFAQAASSLKNFARHTQGVTVKSFCFGRVVLKGYPTEVTIECGLLTQYCEATEIEYWWFMEILVWNANQEAGLIHQGLGKFLWRKEGDQMRRLTFGDDDGPRCLAGFSIAVAEIIAREESKTSYLREVGRNTGPWYNINDGVTQPGDALRWDFNEMILEEK